jgi:hypothetical protein
MGLVTGERGRLEVKQESCPHIKHIGKYVGEGFVVEGSYLKGIVYPGFIKQRIEMQAY